MINPNVKTTAGALESLVRANLENARPDDSAKTKPPEEEPPPAAERGAERPGLKKTAPLPEVHLRELSIRVSPETNRVVIEVIDSETKTVVRKIPPEEALDLLRSLPQQRALLVDREG